MLGSVVFAVSKDTSTTGPMTWETLPVLCDIVEELFFKWASITHKFECKYSRKYMFYWAVWAKKKSPIGLFLINQFIYTINSF
jgi:hypothetical protein